MSNTDEEAELDPFDAAQQRLIKSWRGRHGVEEGGCLYLIRPDSPEWSKAEPVLDEPEFEKAFRTRMDGDQNSDATLVILP